MLLPADPYITERPSALLGLRNILASAVSDLQFLDAEAPGFSQSHSLCLVQVRAGPAPPGRKGDGWDRGSWGEAALRGPDPEEEPDN